MPSQKALARAELVRRVREAGVVGAGGAGFPTHVKVDASVETVIVNGAECEPLLYKDKELLRLEADRLVEGVALAMTAMGAKRGAVALKDKAANVEAIRTLRAKTRDRAGMEVFLLGDYYPSGDEVLLVYDVTGRVPPHGGIPLEVGVMNSNVETFVNVARAVAGEPVTEKWVTVAGAVKHAVTLKVPVGTPFRDCLAAAGGATIGAYALLSGGAMMGKVVGDDDVVDKTSGGWILLPPDQKLIAQKTSPRKVYDRVGRSCCDQCMYCTEFCPRYLVGHPIQPHRVMRTLGLSGPMHDGETLWAQACIHCGLCGHFSCPEDLLPSEISWNARGALQAKGFRPEKRAPRPHPLYEYRKVPTDRLVHRIGLDPWDVPAHFAPTDVRPERVTLRMKQHAGKPAVPAVRAGDRVKKGQLVGEIPEGALGARVHASIDGVVETADATAVIIRR